MIGTDGRSERTCVHEAFIDPVRQSWLLVEKYRLFDLIITFMYSARSCCIKFPKEFNTLSSRQRINADLMSVACNRSHPLGRCIAREVDFSTVPPVEVDPTNGMLVISGLCSQSFADLLSSHPESRIRKDCVALTCKGSLRTLLEECALAWLSTFKESDSF